MIPADPAARHIAIVLREFSLPERIRPAVRMANQWAAVGRRVTIVCGASGGVARAELDADVNVCLVGPPGLHGVFSRAWLGFAAAGAIEALRPDVVVGPDTSYAPALWSLSKTLGPGGPPTVCRIGAPFPAANRTRVQRALFARYLRFMTRDCTALVATTAEVAKDAYTATHRRDLVCVGESIVAERRSAAAWLGLLDDLASLGPH